MSTDYLISCKTCEDKGIFNMYTDDNLRKPEAENIIHDIKLIASIYELKCLMLSDISITVNYSHSSHELFEFCSEHKNCSTFEIVDEHGRNSNLVKVGCIPTKIITID